MQAFDIIVVAGQSNAEGCGQGPAARPYVSDPRICMMPWDSFSIRVAEENPHDGIPQGNFGLSFAREYVEAGLLAEGRGLLLVQAAVGGTGFLDKRWGPRDDLYLHMLAMTEAALAPHPENELKVLLWHQGENDSSPKGKAAYAANFGGLVRGFRGKFNAPGLPFVAGDFVWQWRKKNRCAGKVAAAARAVCEEIGGAFVETEGLLSNDEAIGGGDDIHFCRNALHQLGERYFEAYLKMR